LLRVPGQKIAERIADALTSVLPKRMVDKIIARRLGLAPPA
jgi:hypothetical protein